MLTKLKHVLNNKTLWSVCYETFESHFCCVSLVWAQNTNSVKILHLLQEKFLRIMLFQIQNSHTNPLFKESKILKSFHKTTFQNCIFISKFLKRSTKTVVSSQFQFSFQLHCHNMRRTNLRYFQVPFCQTKTYCRYSMIINATYVWNNFVWAIQDFKKYIPPLLRLLLE